jgi:hypothetical protein
MTEATPIRPWFVFMMMALSFAAGVGFMKLRGNPSAEKQATALASTNQAQFKALDNGAALAAGHTPTQKEIDAIVSAKLGAAVAREIRKQGGAITATAQATGTVQGNVSELVPLPTVPGLEGEARYVGSEVQDRHGLPPLTAVHFIYDQKDGLKMAWDNQTEKFDLSYSSWRSDDEGLHAAMRLTREVNGKSEDIRLTDANVFFPASEVTRITPLSKGDVGIGPFLDQRTGRTKPLLYTSKRWTRSLSTGAVLIPNVGYALIVTHTFGGSK